MKKNIPNMDYKMYTLYKNCELGNYKKCAYLNTLYYIEIKHKISVNFNEESEFLK